MRFALFFGNRGFFPESLVASAREEMEKAVAGNGRKNSGGIRATGRIRGKTAGRRIAAQ